MKKIYLASTALAGVVALAAMGGMSTAHAQAKKVQLTISGSTEQEFGYGENSELGVADFDQRSDAEIHFNFRTTLDNGLKISGRIELEGNTSSDQIDENFMRLSGSFGEVTLGSDDNVANRLSVEPPQAGIGIADIDKWIDENGVGGFLNQDFDTPAEDAEQIQYVTPDFGGFQAGISYIPAFDSDTNNTPASQTDGYSQGWALGAVFSRDLGQVSVEVGANYLTFMDGPAAATSAKGEPEVYNAGIKVGFGGFEVGITGMWVDDMFRDPSDGATSALEDGEMFEIGIGYGAGPWEVSATYHRGESDGLESNTADDESDLFIVSAVRKLGPGVKVHGNVFYANWDGEDVDTAASTDDNDGIGVTFGIKISF